MQRVAVLVGGSGSNLQALIDGRDENYKIALVISHRPGVGALVRAESASIASRVIDHRNYSQRQEFDQAIGVRKVRKAAQAGYPVAQSLLGFIAENGGGVAVESGDQVAIDWWRKGAQGNHCAAIRRMVKAYTNGELGLPADAAKASEWEARQKDCTKN